MQNVWKKRDFTQKMSHLTNLPFQISVTCKKYFSLLVKKGLGTIVSDDEVHSVVLHHSVEASKVGLVKWRQQGEVTGTVEKNRKTVCAFQWCNSSRVAFYRKVNINQYFHWRECLAERGTWGCRCTLPRRMGNWGKGGIHSQSAVGYSSSSKVIGVFLGTSWCWEPFILNLAAERLLEDSGLISGSCFEF